MKKRLKQATASVAKQIKLALFWFVFLIALLIALPSITFKIPGTEKYFHTNGLDLTNISNGKVKYEFQFAPSLDTYGGTETIYTIAPTNADSSTSSTTDPTAKTLTKAQALDVLTAFNQRLKNIGLTEFDTSLREIGTNSWKLVLKVPLTSDKLTNTNSLLSLDTSKISFVKAVQQDSTTTNTTQQQSPQFSPTTLTGNDIKAVSLTYGATTLGYGVVIEFKDTSKDTALVTGLSDVNNNTADQLYLAINNEVIGAQRSAFSSQSNSLKMLTATSLGDDKLAADLLVDILNYPTANTYTLTPDSEPSVITGKFEPILDLSKALFVAATGILCLLVTLKYKLKGYLWSINFASVLVTAIAIFKIANLPLSLFGLFGMFLGLFIWFLDSRKIFQLITKPMVNTLLISELIQHKRTILFRYVMIIAGLSLVLVNINIPILSLFLSYFVVTVFMGVFDYYFSLPATLKLISSNEK